MFGNIGSSFHHYISSCVKKNNNVLKGADDIEESGVEFLSGGYDETDGVACLKSNDVAFKLSQECRKVIASRPRERRIRYSNAQNNDTFSLVLMTYKAHFHCSFCLLIIN